MNTPLPATTKIKDEVATIEDQQRTEIIKPKTHLLDLRLNDLWRYSPRMR